MVFFSVVPFLDCLRDLSHFEIVDTGIRNWVLLENASFGDLDLVASKDFALTVGSEQGTIGFSSDSNNECGMTAIVAHSPEQIIQS